MMSREDAIKWLENFIENIKSVNEHVEPKHADAIDASRYAIEALRKQKPEKPLVRWTGDETVIECPICGAPFDETDAEWSRQFCGKCGQRMDWRREE